MSTQIYKTNLNCGKCLAKVSPYLDGEPAIESWSVDTDDPRKPLTIEGDNVSDETVERLVAEAGFEVLGRVDTNAPSLASKAERSFLETYHPLLLVLAYLTGVVAIVEIVAGNFDGVRAMRIFMGGFFIAFSFFKLLDLRGFSASYQSYDIPARTIPGYGLVYPFIELALGIAYLVGFNPMVSNAVTLALMTIGLIGVAQSLLAKRAIQCACLGTVFDLPMSKVTLIEDGVMALMALAMLILEQT
ncbi:MAG: heavy-metal-associated domain-containing protein [Planctomycetaceae bacterium]|nr:heavy-metal-associated domain-containing protein [Planctomycetaceae bacterium]